MHSNKKINKKLLFGSIIFVTMFFVAFIINYSFAGVKSYRIKVPRSTCSSKDLPLSEQDSSCEARQYFEETANNYEIGDLYEVWGAFDDEQQEFILNYLSEVDAVKHKELNDLINNIKSKKISDSVDDKEVTVITEIPINTSLEIEGTEQEKVDIIKDLDVGIINNDYYTDSYTYDISMNNNRSNYVNNDALITISSIATDTNKKYFVYHLLDSIEAIDAYKDNNNLMAIDSDKFTDEFSKELEAAKEYSNVDNRVYVVVEEANINKDGSVSFTTNSFSTFMVVGYTVDFHYNGIIYSINGETSVLLSQVFEKLNIDKDVSKIIAVTFSNEELVSVTKKDNDWMLTSLQAFDTNEVLTMYFDNGEMFELKVTDASDTDMFPNLANRSNYFQSASYHLNYRAFQYSRWDLYVLDNPVTSASDFNGLTLIGSYEDDRLPSSNYQFKLYHPNRWYYVTKYDGGGQLSHGDNGISDINVYLVASKADMNIYAITTKTYSNSAICTVYQGSANALNYQTKTVGIYCNNYAKKIGYWTGLFPNRDYGLGTSASDAYNFLYSTSESCGHSVSRGNYSGLTVTVHDNTKYYYDPNNCGYRNVSSSGNELMVLLKSRFKVVFHPGEGGTGTMADQDFIYNDGQNLNPITFTRPYYQLSYWATTEDDTEDTKYFWPEESFSTYTTAPGEVVDLYARWEGDPADYKVYEYTQDIPVAGQEATYTKISSEPYETKTGSRVGEYTTAYSNPPTGFNGATVNNQIIVPNTVVNGQTQYTIIELYYPRKTYTSYIYHADIDNTSSTIATRNSVSKYYEETINVNNYIKNDIVGYKYVSSDKNTISVTNNSSDRRAYIYYQYTEVPYTVNYYQKDLGTNTYTKVDSDTYTVNGKIHANITYNSKSYTGFNAVPRVEYIDTNGNTYTGTKVEENLSVVNVYYDRNNYNVSYSYNGTVPSGAPSVPSTVSVEYGSSINLPSISLLGYDFSWNHTSPLVVTGNVNVVGTFSPKNNAYYRVRYYLKGTTTEIQSMDENLNANYNQSYSITAPAITGFTLDDSSSKTVVAGYSGSNNEISFSYVASAVNYTVNYCLENLSGNGCTNDTSTVQGYSLDPISYQQRTITGFTYDHVTDNSNGVINPDGSTVVTLYYNRNSHNLISCVTKDDDSTYNSCQSTSYKYGETIRALTNPSETYYNFSGWVIDTPGMSSLPNTMPDHDINVSGVLNRNLSDLTIVADWGQNITGKVAHFTLLSSNSEPIDIVTDTNGQAVVKDLRVGNSYTITEINCDVGYICDNYITYTIIDGTNTVTFNNTRYPNHGNWLNSTSRNKNIFGIIQ